MTEEKAKFLKTSLENIQHEQYSIYKLSENVTDEMKNALSGMDLCIRGLAGCVSSLVNVMNELIEEGDADDSTGNHSSHKPPQSRY